MTPVPAPAASCPDFSRLEAFSAGAPDPALDAHLATCADCRRRLSEIRENLALLGDLHQVARERSTPPPSAAAESVRIDGYDIVETIARGSQGVVYRAVQRATRREVAVKVLVGGKFATPRQRWRFEREVELAASLRHPHIVTFFDSGTTDDGRRFCVMELVRGEKLDDYLGIPPADGASVADLLPKDEILTLFLKVCSAVEYAHQRGVIHRDLKPANILVDAAGEPRIVDFGLARPSDPARLALDPTMTREGEFAGTFAYASPEQAKGRPDLIDLRTDVYALGVILYEMLTGKLPYPTGGHITDVIDNICNNPPTPPRTARRDLSPDLETILLKALAKSPDRRYSSVGSLARDIEHLRAGQPIDARRDSTWYVLKKTVARHRIPVALGAATVLALAVLTVLMTLAWSRARVAESVADARSTDLAQALSRSNVERGRALSLAGHIAAAEDMLWREHLHPTAPEPADAVADDLSPTRWALRELYLRSRCLSTVAIPYPNLDATAVALSPDASLLAIGLLGSSELELLDPSTGLRRARLRDPDLKLLNALRFSPDARRLYTSSSDNHLRVFETATGALLARTPAPLSSRVSAFATTPALLAAGGSDGAVTLLDARTLKPLWHVPAALAHPPAASSASPPPAPSAHAGRVAGLVFSPDAATLLSSAADGTLKRWSVADGTLLGTLLSAPEDIPLRKTLVLFDRSPDNARLALAWYPGAASLVRADTLDRPLAPPNPTDTVVLAFAPDGLRVATAGNDRTVRLWEPATDAVLTLPGHTGSVRGLTFDPSSRRLVSLAKDSTLRTWDLPPAGRVESSELKVQSHPGSAPLHSLLSTPNPLSPPDSLTEPLVTHASTVLSAALSDDGTLLATGSADGSFRLSHFPSGRPLVSVHVDAVIHAVALESAPHPAPSASPGRFADARVEGPSAHRARLASARLSPEDTSSPPSPSPVHSAPSCLAFGDREGRVQLLRFACVRGVPVVLSFRLPLHTNAVNTLAFSPDRALLASVAQDRSLLLTSALTGRVVRSLPDTGEPLGSVAFSPDGKTLAAAGKQSRAVRRFRTSDLSELAPLRGHTDAVRRVCFSPDGTLLASAGDDQTVRLWDPSTGSPLATLEGHRFAVFALAFRPDSRLLYSAGSGGELRLWDPRRARMLASFLSPTPVSYYGLTPATPDGLSLLTWGEDRTVTRWSLSTAETYLQANQRFWQSRLSTNP